MDGKTANEIKLLLEDIDRAAGCVNEIRDIVENSAAYWNGDAADEYLSRMTDIADNTYYLTEHMKKTAAEQLQTAGSE